MRAHLIASSQSLPCLLGATALLAIAASAGCAHDTTRDVHTTSAPVQVATPPPAPPPAPTPRSVPPSERRGHERGAAPVEDDIVVPGLGSTTRPGGQYGNGTSGASSDTHKGTWRGGEQGADPKPRPPDPTP